MDVITTHKNADFDAFSSMVAAGLLYPGAVAVFPGSQEKKLREFIAELFPFEAMRVKDIDMSSVKRLIIVDAKSSDRIGELAELLERVEVHVYDHHTHEQGDIHGSIEMIEQVGAAATIFTELLKQRKIKPTPMQATALCLGIYQETGSLLYPSTTERDLKAAAHLIKCGASLNVVSNYLKSSLSAKEVEVLNDLTHSARHTVVNGLRLTTAKAASDKYIGDAAHLAHRMMEMEYTDAAVIMLEMDGKVLMVGRSRTPEINIAEALEAFGGGGHPTASSATLREPGPMELIEERVIERVREIVKPGLFAVDVMTSPVITIEARRTIHEVEDAMTRYEVNAIPVVEAGAYRGVITRETVEKALFHGMRDTQAIDLATTDALTAERYTPVAEVERGMIEQNQRFMPVVEGDKVLGAITRTDLLRAMYNESLRRTGIREADTETMPSAMTRNIGPWLRNRMSAELYAMLEEAGRTATGLGYGAYLVGGSVRDIIRGESPKLPDMDIVVEGEGIAFARALGEKLHARVHPHERFNTAKLVTNGLKLDIATARTEYYDSPAALPTVMTSSIKKDLYRRDFTINTLAVALNPERFGTLLDFFGAQRDIKDHTIRVLHNLSFIEDPTRAFRAVRFAERFSYRISRHTENLMKSALRMDIFTKLTGSRIFDELELIFRELEPSKVVATMSQYGLLGAIHPKLEYADELRGLLVSVEGTMTWFRMLFTEEEPDATTIYLTALLSFLDEEAKRQALERLAAPERVVQAVLESTEQARLMLRKMPLNDPALIRHNLARVSLETLLLAMAITKKELRKKEVARYLMEIRNVRVALDGNDLKRLGLAPGPVYSELLQELLDERLRGSLITREDEEHYAARWIEARK